MIKFQLPSYRQGCKLIDELLEQAAQGPIQPGLEHLQGQDNHRLSRQPHQSVKNFPNIKSQSSLLYFKGILPCPITIYLCKKLISLCL